MNNKPTAAFVLSLIGGIFVLLAGVVLAVIGAILSLFIGGYAALFYVGIVIGLLIIVFAVMLWSRPQQHVIWGVLLIVFAIISLFTAVGGFFIGFLLTLIGGILAVVFKPMQGMMTPMMPGQPMMGQPMAGASPPAGAMPPPGAAPPPSTGATTCPYCGGPVNMQTRTCTMCGRPVP